MSLLALARMLGTKQNDVLRVPCQITFSYSSLHDMTNFSSEIPKVKSATNTVVGNTALVRLKVCTTVVGKWLHMLVPRCSPSRGGDFAVYVFDRNQRSLPTPFYSVLVSVSVFMALSTVFHSINSPDNSLLSHSVLQVLFLPLLVLSTVLCLCESVRQPL